MTGAFVTDLALSNLRRNKRAILPFALSCIGMVMMFFILHALSATSSFQGVYGARTLQRTLNMGIWVMMLFSLIFLFYTHSFLVKRRKKEFGLFNILGLEKRHIGRVLLVETLLIGLVTTLLGVALGALLSKLMYLLILRLLEVNSLQALMIPRESYVYSLVVFLAIHALTYLNTLRTVHLARPVELLKGGQMGEKEPKARVWMAVIGLICLGTGYYLSLAVRDVMNAIPDFLKAVLLVIVGTYLLFTAGTISLLRLMQRNKRFYYHPRHFSVVAGMRHRMKRNAVGLATICILCTMVLVMGAVTANLFTAREDLISAHFPREMMLSVGPAGEEERQALNSMMQEKLQKAGLQAQERLSWRSLNFSVYLSPDKSTLTEAEHVFFSPGQENWSGMRLTPKTDKEYLTIGMPEIKPGEALYHSLYGKPLPERITINGHPLRLIRRLSDSEVVDTLPQLMVPNYTLILGEEDLSAIAATLQHADTRQTAQGDWTSSAHTAFNTGRIGTQRANDLRDQMLQGFSEYMRTRNDGGYSISIHSKEVNRADFNALYGGLLFVAIFLGSVFIMAMVLIIYYKQVTEGYEDQEHFLILQQVGMSQKEVKQAIKSQVLMVFFLPLAMAGLHLLAAFNIVWQVLRMMSLNNLGLAVTVFLVTYLVFSVFYLLVYRKTAGSYYRIVRADL